jgi:hypothetical protein
MEFTGRSCVWSAQANTSNSRTSIQVIGKLPVNVPSNLRISSKVFGIVEYGAVVFIPSLRESAQDRIYVTKLVSTIIAGIVNDPATTRDDMCIHWPVWTSHLSYTLRRPG